MPLDFAILNDKDFPENGILLSIEDHTILNTFLSNDDRFILLKRFHDYYQDVEYEFFELIDLRNELFLLKAIFEEKLTNKNFIDDLIVLTETALKNKKKIIVLSD